MMGLKVALRAFGYALVVVLQFAYIHSASAQDALQVMPTRLVLDKAATGELTLVNKGNQAGTYRILLRNIRTDAKGKFETVETAEEGELYADKFVRFSPRRVTVTPGSFQKVRVMVRKPKTLPPGEYRTHMVFQSLPEQTNNALDQTATDKVDVAVQTIVEVSIPVIVRNGKIDADAAISSAKVAGDDVQFTLERSGARSLYGDVEVLVNSGPLSGTRVAYTRGLSVYYPNALREITLPIAKDMTDKIKNQELMIVFTEDKNFGGSKTASTKLTVQ